MWKYTYTDELYHHGRKGMKWGQHIFAKAHARKVNKQRKKNLEKAREAKAKKAAAEKKRKAALEKGRLAPKKMTDDELKSYKTRLQMEKDVKDLVMETRPMKRLMSKMWSDAVVPGLTEGGKELVKSVITTKGKELLGIDGKKAESAYDKLKKANEMAKWEKEMFENKRDLKEAKANYEAYLKDEDAQKAARQKYVESKKNSNNNSNNNNGGKKKKKSNNNENANENANSDSSTKTTKGAYGIKGMKWGKTSGSTEVSTVVRPDNVNRGKSHIDNSNILNGKATYDSDGTMHISYDDDN